MNRKNIGYNLVKEFSELNELYSLIQCQRSKLKELKTAIWQNPELAYQEKFATSIQIRLLKEYGFKVKENFCDVKTAYRAQFGAEGPVFAFVAEYDALPEIGHGCGHNLICTAALAAAYATSKLLNKKQLPGRVVVLGTPAEESGGGKIRMLKNDCLNNIDGTIMIHPGWRTVPDTSCTAIRRFDVEFRGCAAHAATAPELGINALDSVL